MPCREGAAQAAFERLRAWAEPDIVALADCRYDPGLVVDAVEPEGKLARFRFPPMRVAEVAIRGDIHFEVRAIDGRYQTGLPRSRWVPDERPALEAWIGRPFAHGHEHFEFSCQLPVTAA